ncbi:MAG: YciI family protein [Actinomycetota bacterium]
MQYMLLIYGDEKAWEPGSPEEQAVEMKRWTDYTAWLGEKGWMVAGDALHPTDQATTVRLQGSERLVTDGPFAETKEQLGGYYLLDVANLDDAIEAAARCPGAVTGTIELRPVIDFDAPHEDHA